MYDILWLSSLASLHPSYYKTREGEREIAMLKIQPNLKTDHCTEYISGFTTCTYVQLLRPMVLSWNQSTAYVILAARSTKPRHIDLLVDNHHLDPEKLAGQLTFSFRTAD